LNSGYNLLKDRSIRISYEDLIIEPDACINDILNYLQLPSDDFEYTLGSNRSLDGIMGDKARINTKDIDSSGLNTWKKMYRSRFRLFLARKYLQHQSDETLDNIGYPKQQLISDLEKIKPTAGLGLLDILDYIRTTSYRLLTGAGYRRIIKRLLIPKLLAWK